MRKVIALIAIAALLVVGCGGQEDAGGDQAAEGTDTSTQREEPATDGEQASGDLTPVTIGLVIPHPVFLTTMIGANAGHFEEVGLDVTVEIFDSGPSTTQALLAGEIDVFEGGLSEVLGTHGTPGQVVAFVETLSHPGYAFYAREGVEEWEDLEDTDKLVGVSAIGGLDYIVGRYILSEVGYDPDEFEYVGAGPATQRIAALEEGTVDMISSLAPGNFFLDAQGIPQLGHLRDFIDNYPMEVYATTPEYYEENPDVVEALQEGVELTAAWTADNMDEAVDIVQSYLEFPEDQREEYRRTIEEYAPDMAPDEPSHEGYEIITEFYIEDGIIEGEMDAVLSEMFTYWD